MLFCFTACKKEVVIDDSGLPGELITQEAITELSAEEQAEIKALQESYSLVVMSDSLKIVDEAEVKIKEIIKQYSEEIPEEVVWEVETELMQKLEYEIADLEAIPIDAYHDAIKETHYKYIRNLRTLQSCLQAAINGKGSEITDVLNTIISEINEIR